MKRIFIISIVFFIIPSIVFSGIMDDDKKYATELMKKYYAHVWVRDNGDVEISISDDISTIELKQKKEYVNDDSLEYFLKFEQKIKRLVIGSKYITRKGLAQISKCINIENLYVGENYSDDSRFVFDKMQQLRRVEFGYKGQVSKLTIETLAKIKTLSIMDISDLPITDYDVEGFEKMENIQVIHIKKTKITDRGIEIFSKQSHSKLETLNISDNEVTDKCIPYLIKIKSLTNLQILGTKITDQGFVQIKKALPRCQVISREF